MSETPALASALHDAPSVDPAWSLIEDIPRSRHRVIIADGDARFRTTVADALRGDGYSVVESCNGIDLSGRILATMRRQWKQRSFDLLICEARLKARSGLELFAELAEAMNFPPVVFTVTHRDKATLAQARFLEPAAVLEKPIDLDGLRSLVHSIVRRGYA